MVLPRPRSASLILAAALLLVPLASALSLPSPAVSAPASAAPVEVPLPAQPSAWAGDASVSLAPAKAPQVAPALPPVGPVGGAAGQDDCGTGGDAAGYFRDNLTNATPIAFPADCAGSLGQDPSYDTSDIYQFDVPRWGTLEVHLALANVSDASTGVGICVGPFPVSYDTMRCGAASVNASATLATAQAPGSYYAWLYLRGSGSTDYRLRLDLRDWTLGPDCNGGDAGNDPADALVLQAPATCDAFLNPR